MFAINTLVSKIKSLLSREVASAPVSAPVLSEVKAVPQINIFTTPAATSATPSQTNASIGVAGSRELAATSATPAMRFREDTTT